MVARNGGMTMRASAPFHPQRASRRETFIWFKVAETRTLPSPRGENAYQNRECYWPNSRAASASRRQA